MKKTTTRLILLADVKESESVTVDTWIAAKIGNGYERSSTVTGKIVSKGAIIKAYGCSAMWQWVEIDPQ